MRSRQDSHGMRLKPVEVQDRNRRLKIMPSHTLGKPGGFAINHISKSIKIKNKNVRKRDIEIKIRMADKSEPMLSGSLGIGFKFKVVLMKLVGSRLWPRKQIGE
jgi:hypothetical protein